MYLIRLKLTNLRPQEKKHSGECVQDDSAMAAFALGSGDNLRTNRGVYFEIDKQKYKIYRSAPWI